MSRSDELAPVAPAETAVTSRALPQIANPTVRATQPAVATADRVASFIAADFAIEGQLRSTGRVEIAGRVKGRVEADELVVPAGGVVEGDVICRCVTVAGTITGTISADELRVRDTGRVDAEIATRVITVELGASFEGQVRRRQPG